MQNRLFIVLFLLSLNENWERTRNTKRNNKCTTKNKKTVERSKTRNAKHEYEYPFYPKLTPFVGSFGPVV